MSIIKNHYVNSHWLNNYGFAFDRRCTAGNCPGLEAVYSHANGTESLWVTIDIHNCKVYLYNEWECGGLLWEREIDIPFDTHDIDNINETKFIDWLDNVIDIDN